MAKEKTYRNKEERIAHSAEMKRGGPVELLRPISDCNPADLGLSSDVHPLNAAELGRLTGLTVGELCDNLGIKELYYKVAGSEQGMRDMPDVEAVMTEMNIVGTCFAYRRIGERSRAMQQVCGFVEPKQVIGETGEETPPVKDAPLEQYPMEDQTEEPPEM